MSRRLKKAGLAGRIVTLKLKTADFRIRTRSRQLGDPTRLADRIFSTGADLLARETDGTTFRLLGIGVSDFADPRLADPADLVDRGAAKRAAAEAAIDRIRGKFGNRRGRAGAGLRRDGRRPEELIVAVWREAIWAGFRRIALATTASRPLFLGCPRRHRII